MPDTQSDWVAERVLHEDRSRKPVIVRLGRPEKVDEMEWRALIEIVRNDKTTRLHVHGLDSFQTLTLAMKVIRTELAKPRRRLTWEGGEPGDMGFPLYVPDLFGQRFSQRLEKMIAAETEKLIAAAEHRRGGE